MMFALRIVVSLWDGFNYKTRIPYNDGVRVLLYLFRRKNIIAEGNIIQLGLCIMDLCSKSASFQFMVLPALAIMRSTC